MRPEQPLRGEQTPCEQCHEQHYAHSMPRDRTPTPVPARLAGQNPLFGCGELGGQASAGQDIDLRAASLRLVGRTMDRASLSSTFLGCATSVIYTTLSGRAEVPSANPGE